MVLVQAKESKYANTCAREGCEHKTVIGKPYVFDTETHKAYCSKECAEMATDQKVVENGKSGPGFKPRGSFSQQLWRTPDEALTASKIWHETVIPMIFQTCEKLAPSGATKNSNNVFKNFEPVSKLYQEIFLGKMQGGSKN